MYSKAGIGFLRELRAFDDIGWLTPDAYIAFVQKWPEIENAAATATPFLKQNFSTTGEEMLNDIYRNVNPANMNPNNVRGLPRYSWSDSQYAKLRSSQIR